MEKDHTPSLGTERMVLKDAELIDLAARSSCISREEASVLSALFQKAEQWDITVRFRHALSALSSALMETEPHQRDVVEEIRDMKPYVAERLATGIRKTLTSLCFAYSDFLNQYPASEEIHALQQDLTEASSSSKVPLEEFLTGLQSRIALIRGK